MKRRTQVGLYLLVTLVYDGGADAFDPDRFVREAVEDGDLIAAATIALESYGWQLYGFIVRQVQALLIEAGHQIGIGWRIGLDGRFIPRAAPALGFAEVP